MEASLQSHETSQDGAPLQVVATAGHVDHGKSALILRLTGKQASKLVRYKDTEILTTRQKLVDCSKAKRDLDHRCTVHLEEGIRKTLDWMRATYGK